MSKIVSIIIEPIKICGINLKLKLEFSSDRWENLGEKEKEKIIKEIVRWFYG